MKRFKELSEQAAVISMVVVVSMITMYVSTCWTAFKLDLFGF